MRKVREVRHLHSFVPVTRCAKLASTVTSSELHRLWTIGHSNHTPEHFVSLLRRGSIETLLDVRSLPRSQRYPHFDQDELSFTLKQAGIRYVFLGEELGGRPGEPSAYQANGQVDYRARRKSHLFQRGIDQVLSWLKKGEAVMMCAEEDPLVCHRFLMNSAELCCNGVCPQHIRGDGRIESQEEAEDRLLAEAGFRDVLKSALFGASPERASALEEAYDLQAARCAFRWKAAVLQAGDAEW